MKEEQRLGERKREREEGKEGGREGWRERWSGSGGEEEGCSVEAASR